MARTAVFKEDSEKQDEVITPEVIPSEDENRKVRVRAEKQDNAEIANYRYNNSANSVTAYSEETSFDARLSARVGISVFTDAFKRGTILNVTIAGVEEEQGVVYWTCYEGNIVVRVPCSDSFMTLPGDLMESSGTHTLQRQMQFLSKSIGLTIPVVITDFVADPLGGFTATGSRTTALAKIRNSYFGPFANRHVQEGDTVQAQIITIGAHLCYVTVCGLDIEVKKHMLTHRYIADASSSFCVGQNIRFRVTRLIAEKGQRPQMELDARPIELEEFSKVIKLRVKPGQRCVGTITAIRRMNKSDNNVIVNLFLDHINAPAFCKTVRLTTWGGITIGSRVLFEVIGIASSGYPMAQF